MKEYYTVTNPVNKKTYYLYGNNVTLKNGWQGVTYYFSQSLMPNKALSSLPKEYEVIMKGAGFALCARKKKKYRTGKYSSQKKPKKDVIMVDKNE